MKTQKTTCPMCKKCKHRIKSKKYSSILKKRKRRNVTNNYIDFSFSSGGGDSEPDYYGIMEDM